MDGGLGDLGRRGAGGPALVADAADELLRTDPRVLQDPHRLGALRADLEARLGAEGADRALRQAGFLQALRDLGAGLPGAWGGAGAGGAALRPCGARIPFDLRSRIPGPALELEGTWREAAEAQAQVAARGAAGGPSCAASAGYTSGWLTGLLGEDVVAIETACAAAGAPACRFRARRAAAWLEGADRDGRAIVAGLELDALRRRAAEERACAVRDAHGPEVDAAFIDPALPVVHVWGPVMVVPFAGARDSISALDLMVRDESARDVSVVVLDLGGVRLDPGVGALAVEEILDAIERRGADAVLAGIAPVSAPVVARLEARHLLLHGELPEAIAAAFQIAEAQRRVY